MYVMTRSTLRCSVRMTAFLQVTLACNGCCDNGYQGHYQCTKRCFPKKPAAICREELPKKMGWGETIWDVTFLRPQPRRQEESHLYRCCGGVCVWSQRIRHSVGGISTRAAAAQHECFYNRFAQPTRTIHRAAHVVLAWHALIVRRCNAGCAGCRRAPRSFATT